MDGATFIRALADCHPTQAVPLLRKGSDAQWMALKELAQHALDGRFAPDERLPRSSMRWLSNLAHRHDDPDKMRRATLQRGGSKAVLAGKVLKVLARAAVPKLKKVAGRLAREGISTGLQAVSDRIADKFSKKEKDTDKKPKPPASPVPEVKTKGGGDDDDDDELEALLRRSRQLREHGETPST